MNTQSDSKWKGPVAILAAPWGEYEGHHGDEHEHNDSNHNVDQEEADGGTWQIVYLIPSILFDLLHKVDGALDGRW